ncbi:hypothetical protein HU200_005221 [Digitaria exilis]|uniref:Uncharacterized protein n=1 Tax=Digitaria exilis TaxID=1010633 RepID=A0A835FU96_9POAL|nr:hypothetical protein HU200_005221 [Digitaria exilis]CAB3480975.1 unnamed protein product [Digitaria exilis]
MALVPIKPLDGHGGYLRRKESVLLRLHTLGVARVLFDDRPCAAAGVAGWKELAHAEALGVAAKLPDDYVASALCGKLPEVVGTAAVARTDAEIGMNVVWDVARRVVASGIGPEWLLKTTETDDEEQGGYYLDGLMKPGQSTGRRERGEHGHVARNCRRRGFVRA